MTTTFTINQQRAVEETGHNILVAASAGSGKTTVLIERLIQKILSGTSVENFLIVTFTNAAAKEMRERLETALEKRMITRRNVFYKNNCCYYQRLIFQQ